MTNNISRRDWEILSAYLDGALKEAEKDKLERRLESNAKLSATLEELRNVQRMLRNSPQARPPRHFTLTQDMVAEKRGSFWGSAFSLNLVSAIAGVLLVVVLIGDIGSFGAPSGLIAVSAPAESFAEAEESTELIAPAADDALQPQAEETDPGLADDSGAELQSEEAEDNAAARSEDDVDLPAEAASEPEADAADQAAADDSAAEIQSDEAEAGAVVQGEAEPTLAAQEADQVAEDESDTEMVNETPDLGDDAFGKKEVTQQPTESPLPPVAESVVQPTEKNQEVESDVLPRPLLRVIEILLAVIALGTALFARRRRPI